MCFPLGVPKCAMDDYGWPASRWRLIDAASLRLSRALVPGLPADVSLQALQAAELQVQLKISSPQAC
jgi:hypothetical protein